MVSYKRGDIVLVPFPFVTSAGMGQKLRPALVISDHRIRRRFNDLILAAITTQVPSKLLDTEFKVNDSEPYFAGTGLVKTSVVRCEFIMTIPDSLIVRKIGEIPVYILVKIDRALRMSIGL
ncbi:type II toxin-antitoxin system PemK/MazF family toxin [bacterium]|nr:type II toxin-antitoxin system PemK/MazF family toxin [bacterium]